MLLNKSKWVFVIIIFLVASRLAPLNSQAQSTIQKFEILVAGFKIGDVIAEEVKKGETTEYHVNSKASFWFFGRIEVGFILRNTYKKDLLKDVKANSKTTKGNYQSTIIWNNDHYDVNAATYKFENTKSIPDPLYNSSGKFYFHEPKDGDRMLADTYGLVSRVTEKSDGVYEIDINGYKNQYHYVGGKLDKIVVHHPVKNFVVQRLK